MNTDNLILRQNNFPPLTNKGAVITSDDFDNNFINVYKDIVAQKVTIGVDAYNPATTYDDTIVQFATYGGKLWQWINVTPGMNQTPQNDTNWQEVFPSIMGHRKNSDLMLAEGSTDEVTAAEIRAFIDGGLTTTTNLSISTQTGTSLLLESSTGADVTFVEATQLLAGLLSATDKKKLDQLSGENTGDQSLNDLNGEDRDNKATDFLTLNHTLYPSVQAVETRIAEVLGAGSNISTTDLQITTNGTRKLLMNGANATDKLVFKNSADDTDILAIQGDEKVKLHDAYFLPLSDGTPGQYIVTDGSGNLSFATPGGDINIGSDNLTIDEAVRSLKLNGDLGSDYLSIQNNSATELMNFRGNGITNMPAGSSFQVGTYVGNTTIAMRVESSTTNNPAQINNTSGANSVGYRATTSYTGAGSTTGFDANNTATASGQTKIGYQANVNGGTNNYAMSIVAGDIKLSTSGGTKIGTTAVELLSLWGATPIVQPTTAHAAATFTANTSGITDDTATFDGYTIGQIVKALRDIGALA